MTYRVAIIGAGKLGRVHARHWGKMPDIDVVAALDTHPESAQTMGAGIAGYTDFSTLLSLESPDIIDICTPTPSHRRYIEQSAAAGKAIFIEKPLARTLAECDAIAAAVEQAGVPLMPGHVIRYFPAYAAAKQTVDAGGVGTPAAIRAARLSGFPGGGNPQSWYADSALSGGVVLDMILHEFDWLRWCFGPITRVFAKGLYGQAKYAGVLDYALVTLRFASGAVGHVTGSWAHSGPLQMSFEIAGDRGLIDYDNAYSNSFTLRKRGASPSSESPLTPEQDPYFQELRAFADALRAGVTPPVTVYDAREAVRIALAALESIETGKAVTLA